jgi:hypothetical protein
MKKITTLAAIACLGISTITAQTQRTILYEEFTGENCAPCASTNPFVDATVDPNIPTKILLIRYQCNIPSAPGAGSLYQDNTVDVGTRMTYYNTPFAPYARFNGYQLPDPSGGGNDGHAILIHPQYYPGIINDSAIVNAPFGITLTHSINTTADSITINATVTAAMAMNSDSLRLQISLQESEIHFAAPTGTNGEKDFYHVMRKMIPNASGTTLQSAWTNGAMQSFTFKIKIPTYIHDKSKIEIVGFVEDRGSATTDRRVHNAAYSAPQALSLDASIAAISSSAVFCSTSVVPAGNLTNAGQTTLTSCLINYKLDNGTVNTYTWTGSLATGTSTVVTLPSLTTTSGTHTLTIYTSLPNNATDVNSGNDSKKTKVVVQATSTAAPIIEGFVSSTFPPTNWVVYNPDGGTYTWKRSASYGGYQTSTNSAFIQFYNNAADGDKDDLYMPKTDLTTISNPQLKFDWAYQYYTDSNGDIYDSLAVLLSTDCGSTWITLFLDGGLGLHTATAAGSGTEFTAPTAAEWKSKTISLSSYASSNAVQIKFQAINHYGNDLYLDNINIQDAAAGIKDAHGNISFVGVYPNPASAQATVKISLATSEKLSLNVYNNLGEIVSAKNLDLVAGDNAVELSTEKMANGIYTIVVNGANGTFQTKLTVSK